MQAILFQQSICEVDINGECVGKKHLTGYFLCLKVSQCRILLDNSLTVRHFISGSHQLLPGANTEKSPALRNGSSHPKKPRPELWGRRWSLECPSLFVALGETWKFSF